MKAGSYNKLAFTCAISSMQIFECDVISDYSKLTDNYLLPHFNYKYATDQS